MPLIRQEDVIIKVRAWAKKRPLHANLLDVASSPWLCETSESAFRARQLHLEGGTDEFRMRYWHAPHNNPASKGVLPAYLLTKTQGGFGQ